MVSVLDSRLSSPGSSPAGQGAALCSVARHFILKGPLYTPMYKWLPVMDLHSIYPGAGLEKTLIQSALQTSSSQILLALGKSLVNYLYDLVGR